MRLRILDIDGSLPRQAGIAAFIAEGRAQLVDLRHDEKALRLWSSAARLRRLGEKLEQLGVPAGSGPLVTFYGSGDYHHLATAWIGRETAPLSIVHFDNHPDWVRFPPTHNCGGWVNRALALPHVQRVVTLGVCSDDLVHPQWKSGNVAALGTGRLEVHPWKALPSRVWGRVADGAAHRQANGHLQWRCLADQDWREFLERLQERLPEGPLWLSIDKDVLRSEDALTNWDQGQMPLEALLVAIERLARARPIAGVDVCGEYSAPRFQGPIKRVAAWLDHPSSRPAQQQADVVNDRTNRLLIAALSAALP